MVHCFTKGSLDVVQGLVNWEVVLLDDVQGVVAARLRHNRLQLVILRLVVD